MSETFGDAEVADMLEQYSEDAAQREELERDLDDDEVDFDDLDYYVNDLGMTPSEALDSARNDARDRGWREALSSAATYVAAAGCICGALKKDHFRGKWAHLRAGKRGSLRNVVEVHDPRCPDALAAKIREGIA